MKKATLIHYFWGTIILLVLSLNSIAQQRKISGLVHEDKNNSALNGATISLKNSTISTVTKPDGTFEITVPQGKAELNVSFVGYETQSIKVGAEQTSVIVTLNQSSISQLSDVVVVGYGTQRKVDLTGAISTLGSSQLENRPVTNSLNALEGTMAGVTVQVNNGQPGQDEGSINIRGIGTLNNSSPMVIVDGNIATIGDVNPNDIESISVLKDAASSAIYGSRAANGVILITTKKGKKGTSEISYNDYFGKQKATALPDYLPSWQAATLYNQALVNEGHNPIYTPAQIQTFKDGSDPYNYPNTNWLGLFYDGSGLQQSHDLSVSGGNDKTQYFFSMGYFDEDGLVKKTNTQRYSTRLNLTSKVADHLTVFANFSYTYQPSLQPQSSYPGVPAFSQMIRQVNRISPMIPYKWANGDYGYIGDGSPMAWLNSPSFDEQDQTHYQGIAGADLEIIKGLHFRPQLAYRVVDYNDHNFIANIQYYDSLGNATLQQGPNNASQTYYQTTTFTPQAVLDYGIKFGDHSFKALAGFSEENDTYNYLYGYRQNFLNNSLSVLNLGSPTGQATNGDANDYALRSYFGRINYDYKGKYLLEGNLRDDGSSRFAPSQRWGLFPSASAGWRVSEEDFFAPLKSVVSELKLRGSWGKLGNQNVAGTYPYIPTVSGGLNYVFGGSTPVIYPGIAPVSGVDATITWETTTETDLGLDGALLKNKLNFSIDYFVKNTNGILYSIPVGATYGLTAPVINAASVQNKGWELTLGYHDKIGAFTYNISGNASLVKNTITSLAGTGDVISGATIWRVGLPINAYYGYQSQGIFQSQAQIASHASQENLGGPTAPGDLIYKDQNGDSVINSSDKVYLGSNFPKIGFGLNVNVGWKGFDLTAFFQGVAGVKNYTQGAMLGQNNNSAGKPTSALLNSWSPTNTSADFPRLWIAYQQNDPSFTPSSFWIRNASYVRLKNLQLGYTLPEKWTKAAHLKKLRIYYSGQNVFTLTQFYKWVDPEAPSGTSGYDYPEVKVNTLGLNITF